MFKRWCFTFFLAVSVFSVTSDALATEECGEITIGSANWASAEVIAEIDKIILSAGYGCEAVLFDSDSMSAFTSMNEFGKPDLVPEVWVNSVQRPLDAAVNNSKMIIAAEVLTDGGEEGLWIPRYIADEHPEIKTLTDALARPDLFALPDEPALGAVHNCPPAWACRIAMDNLFRAHGAEGKRFTLVNTGSAAGLDASIARAHADKRGWLGYYWAPNGMLGRYDMVKLDMGEHDAEHWRECTSVPDCPEPMVNAWQSNQVFSIVTTDFAEKAGVAMDYISKRQWSNKTVNELLAWMGDTQATGEEVAYYFLENFEPIWSSWVAADVVSKVKNRL